MSEEEVDDDMFADPESLESDEENELYRSWFGNGGSGDGKELIIEEEQPPNANQFIPFDVPKEYDIHARRPEYKVDDAKAYYIQISGIIKDYAQVCVGYKKVLFDKEKQTLVTKPVHFDFRT